jgi:hypothetical protein
MMRTSRELRDPGVYPSVEKSRPSLCNRDSAPRFSFKATSRLLPLVAVLAGALVSGTALARGGGGGGGHGGGGGGHGGGGHASGGQCGSSHSGGGSGGGGNDGFESAGVVQAATMYGRRYVTSPREESQRVVVAASAPVRPYPSGVGTPLSHPSSSADIYVYKDAHGVIHFTDYEPQNGQGQVYIRGEAR